ncbi:hypothetical protein [Streptomyces sp. UNOB3_S3]|uniref:hypothetical protein n=1 Tax=Streptomyces sp. UNOB3_S3 TaxID=2871682 RepID=UPI001E2F1FC3|nr:hypothetical protein [Streptomyces sp. UNOB3_S3]MCC3773804.1 hypothetical protein [Streptomyces sp. UNOB3_S3]
MKSIKTAGSYFTMLVRFATFLSKQSDVPQRPEEISSAHVAAFKLSLSPGSQLPSAWRLRTLMRDAPCLPAATRAAILHGRLPERETDAVLAYSEDERQQILTAVRHDVRSARDRIRASRDLLDCYRRGETEADEERLGGALDVIDRTGDVPRDGAGRPFKWMRRYGGTGALVTGLCLTRLEAAAFSLLLVDMTGENFGTVGTWPAAHFRPDGGVAGAPALALVEGTKPRRGPDREYMVTPVEDLPESLAGLFVDGDDSEVRLFRSPLRVYLLLLELTELSRRHGGHDLAFGYVRTTKLNHGRWAGGIASSHTTDWAAGNGFPLLPRRGATTTGDVEEAPDDDSPEPDDQVTGLPSVDVLRLRQTALERIRRPVAHSRQTLNDRYLKRSPAVRREGREIVRTALEEQVAKARGRQQVPVFSAAFAAMAEEDPQRAAAEMGVGPDVLKRILAGQEDTVLASCADHRDGPDTPPGEPCTASFLACLSCRNARALPHHLPVQVYVHDQLAQLRTHIDPDVWAFRYGDAFARLTHLIGPPHYTAADREQARTQLTEQDRHLADDLLEGRLDL